MGLYQSVLGEDFEKLGNTLREFHTHPETVSGHLSVSHHTHWVPKFFVWLMRLPKQGSNLETHLEVDVQGEEEVWSRKIGEVRLVTRQRVKNGKLVEIAGPISFVFDVEAEGEAMVFHHYRSTLLGIPIPKHIAPVVNAKAQPMEKGWSMWVDILCPRYGTICRYEGEIGF